VGFVKVIDVEVEIDIARPPRDVFDFLTKPSNMPVYITPATAVHRHGRGKFGVGSAATVEITFMGVTFRQDALCTVYRRPHSFAARSKGGRVHFEGQFELQAVKAGTHLRGRGRADLGGIIRLAAPVLRAIVRRQVESDLRRLKSRLEA
jgi:carbon monoxide dehydrogenase subunit G